MVKGIKKILLLFTVIAALVSGCDKYEQTLKKIYGQYALKTYSVNGIDSLSLYRDSLGTSFRFFYDDVNALNGLTISGSRTDGNENHLNSQWILMNDNTILKINTAYGATGTGPFGYMKTPEWEIISLTKKEIKMSTNYNDKEYIVNLNRL